MMYVAFRCTECGDVYVLPSRTADGYRCKKCGGISNVVAKGTKEEMERLGFAIR